MANPEATEAIKKILESLTKPKGLSGLESVAKPGENSKKSISQKAPSTEEVRKTQAKEADKTQKEVQHVDKDSAKETTRTYSIQKDIADHETESVHIMTARERLQLLDEKFKPESAALQGGIHALQFVGWDNPSPEQWSQIQDVIKKLPTLGQVGANDRAVLREIHQTVLTHYHINRDAINPTEDLQFQRRVRESLPYASDKRLNEESIITSVAAAERGPYARSSSRADSREWADEVAPQILNGKRAPEVQLDNAVNPELVNREIAEKSSEAGWLVKNGEHIQNVQVAQVVHDILNAGDLAEDKEYLLAKASQLKHINQTDTPELERTEIETCRERIKAKMLDACKKDSVPKDELNDWIHEASGFESGQRGRRQGPHSASADKVTWDAAEDPIPTDPRFNSLRTQIDDFNRDIQDLTSKIAIERREKSPNQGKIIELQEQLNEKVVDMLVIKMPSMSRTEGAKIPHLREKLEEYRVALVKHQMEQGYGYSSIYVPEKKMREYQLNALKTARQEQDDYNQARRLLPNRLQQSIERSLEMNIMYLQSEQYRDDVLALFQDKANFPDIERETGTKVDRNHPENHPLYKRMKNVESYKAFRQKLIDSLTYPDLLEKNYTSWQLGRLEEMGISMAGFGEPGVIAVLNNRAINVDSFDVLEALYDNLVGPNGEQVVPSGPVQEKALEEAKEVMWTHRARLIPKFKEEYGPNAEITREDIDASVEEVHMLLALTGQRAKAARRCLTQWEGRGSGINPVPFSGESSGDNKLNQSIEPIRQLFLRWKVASAVQRVWIETIARLESWRYGFDVKWKQTIDRLDESSNDYKRLVKRAFNILEEHTPGESNEVRDRVNKHIKDCLSVMQYDRFGNEIKHPPEKIEDIHKKDLLRWLIIRDGTQAAEPQLMAGYSYFDVGWNEAEQIHGYDEQYGMQKGIGVLERLKMQVSELFDPTITHGRMHDIQEELTHRDNANPHDEGMMVVTARYMPVQMLRALKYQEDPLANDFINSRFNRFNIFHDRYANGLSQDAEGAVTADRPDLFFKRYEMTQTMINRGLADWEDRSDRNLMKLDRDHPDRLKRKGLGPIDWSAAQVDPITHLATINDPRQMQVVTEWCQELGVNPNEFIAVSKELSDFALRHDVQHVASHPLAAKYFLDNRKVDARFYRLDEGDKIWTEIPTGTGDGSRVWMNDRKRYIGKWSSRIANVRGHGISGGLPRFIGDQMNVFKVLVPHLVPLSKARSIKEWETHFDPFCEQVTGTGGDDARGKVAHTLTLAYLIPNRMFLGSDMIGTSDETFREVSINQRVGGKGFQALTMNEGEEVIHHGESVAGVKFHKAYPNMDHATQKEAGLIITLAKWPKFMNKFGDFLGDRLPNRVTIGGKTYRINLGERARKLFHSEISLKTVWVYRILTLLGLGVVIIALKGAENAKKGFSGGSGGGGGGGHPQHE